MEYGYNDVLRGFGGSLNSEIYFNDGPPNYTFGDATQQPDVLIGAAIGGGEWNHEGIGAIDWNQDGWLDLVVDNDGGGYDIFENDKLGGFFCVMPGTGPGETGFRASHAGDGDYLTVGDMDNDGDLDLYTVVVNGENQLWENTTNDSNYLYINAKVVNPDGSTRDAIGANVIMIQCGDYIESMRQVNGGKGHGSQHQNKIHYGLTDPGFPVIIKVFYVYKDGSRAIVTRTVVPSEMWASINSSTKYAIMP